MKNTVRSGALILAFFLLFNATVFAQTYDTGTYDVGYYGVGEEPPAQSSSSGGGGSILGGLPPKNITGVNRVQNILSQVPIILQIDNPRVEIREVFIQSEKNASGVRIVVKKIDSPQQPLVESDKLKVYQYDDVSSENIDPNAIATVRIRFRILKTWIYQSGMNQNNIVLKQFVDGEWIDLPTYIIAGDLIYNEYDATTTMLSLVAIAAVAPEKVAVPAGTTQTVEKATTLEQPGQSFEQQVPNVMYILLIYLLVGVIFAMIVMLIVMIYLFHHPKQVVYKYGKGFVQRSSQRIHHPEKAPSVIPYTIRPGPMPEVIFDTDRLRNHVKYAVLGAMPRKKKHGKRKKSGKNEQAHILKDVKRILYGRTKKRPAEKIKVREQRDKPYIKSKEAGFDELLKIVEKQKSVKLSEAAKKLRITNSEAEAWARELEERDLIKIKRSLFGAKLEKR